MSQDGISARIVEKRIRQNGMDIVYPQVAGLPDPEAQERINRAIGERVRGLIARQRRWPDSAGIEKFDMTGTYRVTVNKKGVLSVRLENYIFPEQAAHGLTMADSVTADLKTGKVYTLKDLFRRGTDYLFTLNMIIREQFRERDLPMINEFRGITANQDFYLTPKNLVIYFQVYEYTPYYVGIPEFEIPYQKIINYIDEKGPIGRLLSDRAERAGN
ncbi:MAG: DUF3298 and DUF4163 domain-containing protein [Peptococcaceae bacterium]|nr:DUF3298 and DUF4163 domain-containing protein [Peptococcaceae bacterium]